MKEKNQWTLTKIIDRAALILHVYVLQWQIQKLADGGGRQFLQ